MDRGVRPRSLGQNRIKHKLRTVREAFRTCWKSRGFALRRHGNAAKLVTIEAGHEHVVEGEVFRKAPMLDLLGNAPPPAEFDGSDPGREHLGIDYLAVGLLDQQARNTAPTEVESEREADRTSANDEDRDLAHPRHSAAHGRQPISD